MLTQALEREVPGAGAWWKNTVERLTRALEAESVTDSIWVCKACYNRKKRKCNVKFHEEFPKPGTRA